MRRFSSWLFLSQVRMMEKAARSLPAASGAERTKGQSFPARAAATTVAAAAAAAWGARLLERLARPSSAHGAPRPGR